MNSTTDNPIIRTIDRHSQANQAIRAAGVDFGRLYDKSRARLNRKLAEAALTTGKVNDAKFLSILIETLSSEYSLLEADFRSTLKSAVPYVAQSFYFEAMHDMGKTVLGKFDRARAEYLLADSYTHVAGATNKMLASDVAYLRQISSRIFAKQGLSGVTQAETAVEISRALAARKSFQFIDKGGRLWDSKKYSEMLGRTVTMNSGRKTYFDTCLSKGRDLVRVTVSGNSCPDCAVWENRLLSITGATAGYPTIEEATAAGLFHPNCTHSTVAVPDSVVAKKFDKDGRPLSGWNASDKQIVNDKAAWQAYRKNTTRRKNDTPTSR